VENAIAFDTKQLSTLNASDFLMKVIKSVVIHGFNFAQALEHALKECAVPGKHTNILHITPSYIIHYV
jgi:hypothetical protein